MQPPASAAGHSSERRVLARPRRIVTSPRRCAPRGGRLRVGRRRRGRGGRVEALDRVHTRRRRAGRSAPSRCRRRRAPGRPGVAGADRVVAVLAVEQVGAVAAGERVVAGAAENVPPRRRSGCRCPRRRRRSRPAARPCPAEAVEGRRRSGARRSSASAEPMSSENAPALVRSNFARAPFGASVNVSLVLAPLTSTRSTPASPFITSEPSPLFRRWCPRRRRRSSCRRRGRPRGRCRRRR